MYPYRTPQLTLFYQLVEESNPGLTHDLPANSTLGTPVSQTVPNGSIADTNILITGKGLYYKNKKVQYRRIDLAKQFLGMTVTFDLWVSTATLAKAQLIELLNATYGLALIDADLTVTSLTSGTPTTITIASASLCYKGSLVVTWTKGRRPITDIITATDLGGRLFPGGNTFGGGRKKQGEYLCYPYSLSILGSTFNSLTAGTLDYNNAAHQMIIDYLTANISPQFSGSDHTVNGGLNGLTFARYTLPNANVPEANANRAGIGSVFVITAQATSWFQGKILLHY